MLCKERVKRYDYSYGRRTLFKKPGHEVVAAENGGDCLATWEQKTLDVVLPDILMPVMNGAHVLECYQIRVDTTIQRI
jgi:CheY-like chemotaxis protein